VKLSDIDLSPEADAIGDLYMDLVNDLITKALSKVSTADDKFVVALLIATVAFANAGAMLSLKETGIVGEPTRDLLDRCSRYICDTVLAPEKTALQ